MKQLIIPFSSLILQLLSQAIPAGFLGHYICYKLQGEIPSLSTHCTSSVHPAFNPRAKIGESVAQPGQTSNSYLYPHSAEQSIPAFPEPKFTFSIPSACWHLLSRTVSPPPPHHAKINCIFPSQDPHPSLAHGAPSLAGWLCWRQRDSCCLTFSIKASRA